MTDTEPCKARIDAQLDAGYGQLAAEIIAAFDGVPIDVSGGDRSWRYGCHSACTPERAKW